MTGAPKPANETARLAALQAYKILDTAAEPAFDDLTYLASYICATPMAAVSLIDAHRQWFKSAQGMGVSETPREHAFCAHTILGKDPLVVENAVEDPRFRDNPMVTADNGLRFYAGAPLIDSAGNALGALCVKDAIPRKLPADRLKALKALARQAVVLMELRRVSAELAGALSDVKQLSRLLPICAWCKEVRDDKGYWSSVEQYLGMHGTESTAAICPKCLAEQKLRITGEFDVD